MIFDNFKRMVGAGDAYPAKVSSQNQKYLSYLYFILFVNHLIVDFLDIVANQVGKGGVHVKTSNSSRKEGIIGEIREWIS